MDSVACSAWSLDRQLLEISMKDLEQEGKRELQRTTARVLQITEGRAPDRFHGLLVASVENHGDSSSILGE